LGKYILAAIMICIFTGFIAPSLNAVEAHLTNNPWVRNMANEEVLIINAEDRFVETVPVIYDYARRFLDGYATVSLDGLEGVIDKSGNVIIPIEYAWVSYFSDGWAAAETVEGKYLYFDNFGNEVFSVGYDEAMVFSDGLAPVCLDGKWGFIDKSGNEVIAPKYDSTTGFCSGYAPVSIDCQWGFIDQNGNEVLPLKYDAVLCFEPNGYAWVMIGGLWGLVDVNGETVIPFTYRQATNFSEGLASVQFRDRWGFIDEAGNTIIPFIYEYAYIFEEGLAPVTMNGKWAFIGYLGNLIVPLEFASVSSSSGGLIVVEDNWVYTVIDKFGNPLLSGYYDAILGFNDGMTPVISEGKWGFIQDLAYTGPQTQSYDGNSVLVISGPQTAQNNNEGDLLSRVISFAAGVIAAFVIGSTFMVVLRRLRVRKTHRLEAIC